MTELATANTVSAVDYNFGNVVGTLLPQPAQNYELQHKQTREKLEARFPDSAHSVRDGFTYVDPMHYRDRLNDVFTAGYMFRVFDIKFRPEGIYGSAYFRAILHGVLYEREVVWSEPWMFASGTKDIIKPDVKMQMADSAALKSICRELGIGLYLYNKQNPASGSSVNAAPQQYQQTQQPQGNAVQQQRQYAPSGNADTDVFNFGTKYKGWMISSIPDEYFVFMGAPDKSGPATEIARAVMQRRSSAAAGQTFGSVTQQPTNDDGFMPDQVEF